MSTNLQLHGAIATGNFSQWLGLHRARGVKLMLGSATNHCCRIRNSHREWILREPRHKFSLRLAFGVHWNGGWMDKQYTKSHLRSIWREGQPISKSLFRNNIFDFYGESRPMNHTGNLAIWVLHICVPISISDDTEIRLWLWTEDGAV